MEGASSSEGGGQGGKKGKKNKKDKKGGGGQDGPGSNEGDWRWKNQLDMVKWTDRMINVGLMVKQIEKKLSSLALIVYMFKFLYL